MAQMTAIELKPYISSTQIEQRELRDRGNVVYRIEKFFNAEFDYAFGYISNGEFSIKIYDNDNLITEAKSEGTENVGVFLNINKLRKYKPAVEVYKDVPKQNSYYNDFKKISIESNISNYEDLQLLFDKYIYDILYEVIVGEESSDEVYKILSLINKINKEGLQNIVSKLIAECIASYSASYERNYSKLDDIEESSGISAKLRFDICNNDEEFRKSIINNRTLFQMAIDAKDLKGSNVRENKNKAMMDLLRSINLDSFENKLDYILSEGTTIPSVTSSLKWDGLKAKIKKERRELGVVISEGEKERIEELELEFMNGSADIGVEAEYKRLIDTIKNRIVDRCIMYVYAASLAEIYKVYSVFDKLAMEQETNKIQEKIKSFELKQSDNISASNIYKQNQKLANEIDKHASFMDEGILYIDFEKQAVINKIKEILEIVSFGEEAINKNNAIRRFISTDIVNLKGILYNIEAMGGMKKAFAGKKVESARRDFFGEHYKLNNKIELYKLFSAAKKQKVDISRMIFNVLSNYIEEGDINHETLENIISNAMNCQGDINSKLDSLYNTIQDKLESNFSKKSLNLAFQTIKTHFEQMDKKEFMQLENTTELQSILNNAEGFLVNKVRAQDVSELKRSMNLMLKETMHDEINSLIDSVDDLYDDKKHGLDLYKLLEYRIKLQEILSRTQGDEFDEERVTRVINYVDEKLLNFPVDNENKEKTIYEKDEAAYKSILDFEKACKDCVEMILLKNNYEYQNLNSQKESLEESIKQVESGSGLGLSALFGKKEEKIAEKKRELERQIDSIDSKMAAIKKAFDCNYGNELDDALRNLANGLSASFDSGDSIYVRDSAEKAAAKENRWE